MVNSGEYTSQKATCESCQGIVRDLHSVETYKGNLFDEECHVPCNALIVLL